jgi:hypothetical protein
LALMRGGRPCDPKKFPFFVAAGLSLVRLDVPEAGQYPPFPLVPPVPTILLQYPSFPARSARSSILLKSGIPYRPLLTSEKAAPLCIGFSMGLGT